MIVTPVRTAVILPGAISLPELLDKYLSTLSDGSIVAITSKIVSLCEGRTVKISDIKKDELVAKEADYLLKRPTGQYKYAFTITNHTLIPAAGIDESNGNGNYILWPKRPQKTANQIRNYLHKRFSLKQVGVIITDSTSTPLRYGTAGIAIAHSGFLAVNDYRGKPDLFGRRLKISTANIAGNLAAASVAVMGEGAESTPLAVIKDVPFVQFQDRNPTEEELAATYVPIKEDLFAPFLNAVQWQKGSRDN